MTRTIYVSLTSDHPISLLDCPTVTVGDVYTSKAAATRADKDGKVVLPVWFAEGAKKRAPRPGERVGTFRDFSTVYAMAPAAE